MAVAPCRAGREPVRRSRRLTPGCVGKRAQVRRASIVCVNLRLSILEGSPLSDAWTTKPFLQTCGFDDNWWVGTAKVPVVFCSFTTDDRVR
jgi:hypothetical protein